MGTAKMENLDKLYDYINLLKENTPDMTADLLAKRIKNQFNVDYSVKYVSLLVKKAEKYKNPEPTPKDKPIRPAPFTGQPSTPKPTVPTPVATVPKKEEHRKLTAVEKVFADIFYVKRAADNVGGLDQLIELATAMKKIL